VNPKPPACAGCPAYERGLGFVPPEPAAKTPRFVVVGQGPGEQEAQFSRPFYPHAPSGRLLRGWLAEAGIDPREVTIGNIVQCWLPKVKLSGDLGRLSRAPTRAEVEFCYRTHWHGWLADAVGGGAHVLAVGAPAARFLLGLSDPEPVEHLAGVTHCLPSLPMPEEPTP